MFKNRVPRSRTAGQAARVVFGLVLIAGAVRIVGVAHAADRAGTIGHATAVALAQAWSAAVGAALVTYAMLRVLPAMDEREHVRHASFVLPAVGAALVLPLSLHALWKLAAGSGLATFDEWAWMSIVLTALAHVEFAALVGIRASQLARGKPPLRVRIIYVATIGAGMVPFPVIPSLIIAITGIPILPLLCLMKPLAARERASRGPRLPVASTQGT